MSNAQGINSVEIAVAILNELRRYGEPMRAIDLARNMDMSRSRLHKYLVSLVRCNMIHQNPQSSLYSLGSNLINLADAAQEQSSELYELNTKLIALSERLNVSTGLCVKKGSQLSLVYYNRSRKNIEVDYRNNTPLPLSSSAAGKVYLAFCEDYKGEKILDEAEYQSIHDKGYALRLSITEGIPGAKALACPVFDKKGRIIAAPIMMGFLPDDLNELHELAQALINQVGSKLEK